MSTRHALLGLTFAALLVLPVLAQQASPPQRIRGEIAKIEGDMVTVKTRTGEMVSVKTTEKTGVAGIKKTDFSEVSTGKFVGIASQPQPDGSLKAIEVLVFPEAMRGRNEGHYPWDLTQGSMMTNANVSAAVESKDGRELTLTPKGHDAVKVTVPENVPIVTFGPADKSMIVPGAKVFVVAAKQPDGSLNALFVAVGMGIMPPM